MIRSNTLLVMFASAVASIAGGATADAATQSILTERDNDVPTAAPGSIRRFDARCESLGCSYIVDVWLPSGYDGTDSGKRYPVVYMHDGQNLFDPTISFAGAAWEIDKALGHLIDTDVIDTPIVVGIHNRGGNRPADYIPELPLHAPYMTSEQFTASGMPQITGYAYNGDEYAAFVATELKPAIDKMFATAPERDHTFIMGSSMGGLASLYALCEYPDVYGGAACLSTHWIGTFDQNSTIFPTAMLSYMSDRLPSPDSHRLYLDRGTLDLDSYYDKWEEQAREIARGKGYSETAGTLYTFTDKGASHNEIYWSQRVDRPLHFLLHNSDAPYTPITPEVTTFHVIYQDAAHNWAAPHAFVWSNGLTHLGTWPGTSMTQTVYNGAPAWEISFDHKIAPTNIIFNDGRASGAIQTKNLVFENNTVYDFNGKTGILNAGLNDTATDRDIDIRVDASGRVIVSTDRHKEIMIATLDGRHRTVSLHPGENDLGIDTPGIYIIGGIRLALTR